MSASLAPGSRRDAAEGLAWDAWRASAVILGLDPWEDASTVAVSAAIGSCGVVDDVALALPSARADLFAARVAAAVESWWSRYPPGRDDETRASSEPARLGWAHVPEGMCAGLQVGDSTSWASR